VTALADLAERALLARQRLSLPFEDGVVRPSYDGLGLVNVAALAVDLLAPAAPRLSDQAPAPPLDPALLGVPAVADAWHAWRAGGADPGAPRQAGRRPEGGRGRTRGPINHVVVLLLDALGYDQLRRLLAEGVTPGLARAIARPHAFFMPITSVFPSTTTTALTSLATAYAPAWHGVMGTTVYLREIGSAVNLLGHRPAIAPTSAPYTDSQLNPETLLPVPNIYRRLEAAGVPAEIVNAAALAGTSISRFTTTGSRAGKRHFHGYLTPADGFAQCRERLRAGRGRGKSYIFLYAYTVDSAAHRYGPLTAPYRAEMAALDFALERELFEPLAGRDDVAILLVADHGQQPARPERTVWLNDHPDLARLLLVPLTGEPRAGYLFVRHGAEAAALAYVEQKLGDRLLALPKARAAALGLFGPPGAPLGPACDDRTGDLLLLPRGDWVVRHHLTADPRTPPSPGVHGGLSRAEMLVPFLAYRCG
jgi:hypothetical protein